MDIFLSVCGWVLWALLWLCAAVGASSQLLSWAKSATGAPKPDDSPGRRRWFRVLKWWDVASRNSPTIECQLQTMQRRLELEQQQRELSKRRAELASASAVIEQQHAVIQEQERNHAVLLTALKKEAP